MIPHVWDHLGWLSALHWWGPEGRNSIVCSYIYIYTPILKNVAHLKIYIKYTYLFSSIYIRMCIHTYIHTYTHAHTHTCVYIFFLLELLLTSSSARFYLNVPQMSMSVPVVYTLATVQLHVPTILDPTHVPVTILLQEMEKLATWHQVSWLPFSMSNSYPVCSYDCF